MSDDFPSQYAFNRWANDKMLDACRKLTADQFVAEPVPGWSPVRTTLWHISIVTEGWLKAVTDAEHVTVEMYIRDSVWPSVALKQIVGNTVQVTDEDLKKGFESNYGERVDVQAIVVSNQDAHGRTMG